MSFQAVTWAIEQKAGGPSAKATLWSIANYANENWCAWPSQRTICAESEQSPDAVQRRLPELEERGLLRRVPLRFAGRKTVDFIILAPSPFFQSSVEELTELLPRGCSVDPKFCCDHVAADSGNVEGALPQTLPQPLPQIAADAAALVRQQEPVTEPLEPNSERESARAKGDARKRFAREFRKTWPTAALDDQAKLDKAIDALPEDQHQACLDGIAPFVADLKTHGRAHVPAGWRYIEERRWTLLPPREAKTPGTEFRTFKCWSREWWATLLLRIAAGQPTAFMLDYALNNAAGSAAAAPGEWATEDALAAMMSFPSDGDAIAAWRPWFEVRGVKLPVWRERFWVWLPGPAPPEGSNAWEATAREHDPPEEPEAEADSDDRAE